MGGDMGEMMEMTTEELAETIMLSHASSSSRDDARAMAEMLEENERIHGEDDTTPFVNQFLHRMKAIDLIYDTMCKQTALEQYGILVQSLVDFRNYVIHPQLYGDDETAHPLWTE